MAMTTMLKDALARVSKLPEEEQDALAAILMAEMESEARWKEAFESSQDSLAELAREATAEYKAGCTRPCNPE
jgi:hypothetical protein